jgi:hypothetical protein
MTEDTQEVFHINGTGTVTILHGDAPKPVEPRGVEITGNIYAPLIFAQKRTINAAEACLTVSEEEGFIVLITDEHTTAVNGHKVIGTLKGNAELKAWGINSDKVWPVRDLLKHIRYNKGHFLQATSADILIEKLSKFAVRVDQGAKDESSKKDSLKNVDKKITHDLPESFTLQIPIYTGDAAINFAVEPVVDMRGDQPVIWLESVELSDAIKVRKKELLTQISKDEAFKDIAVIWK